MLAHISRTSSKGSCSAQKWVRRESLSLTLLLTVICHVLGMQEWSFPLAKSIILPLAMNSPCLSQSLLFPVPVDTSPGVPALGWPGREMQGCSHPCLLTAQREERSCASCLATPLNISILSENIFSSHSMGFSGAGSGLADQVVLRDHTSYLEGLHTLFGQVLAKSMGCKSQLPVGTAQQGGL